MKSQTSLIASQCRLQQWAKQIQDCQNRPADMQVAEWCEMNGITTSNYYYRLRRVREAYIEEYQNADPAFIELPVAKAQEPVSSSVQPFAILRCKNGMTFEILPGATPEFLKMLIGVAAYAE